MRFELKSEDVIAMVRMVYELANILKRPEFTDKSNSGYTQTMKGFLWRIVAKLSMYALEAFPNREKFREEIKMLKESVGSIKP